MGELIKRRAAAAAAEGQLDAEKRKRMHQFLASDELKKREGAYGAMRKLGEDYREEYGEMLVMAKEFHRKALVKVVKDELSRDRSVEGLKEAYAAWAAKRVEAFDLVRTNWKVAEPGNYGAKHKEMDGAFGEAEAAYGKVLRAMKPAGTALVQLGGKLEGPAGALGEIERELAWCDGRDERGGEFDPDGVLSDSGAGEVADSRRLMAMLEAGVAETRVVARHNAGSDWAGEELKVFAVILNGRRAALGLGVLRLDELLSNACAGHSEEMGRLGYFAHESPVEENRNFGKRARNHEFEGQPVGECIYVGGGGAKGSHGAWWYSDGHRLIMYMDGPNTLGLGVSGSHWTLNTGKKAWPKG